MFDAEKTIEAVGRRGSLSWECRWPWRRPGGSRAEGEAFALTQIERVFDNGRPDVTVPKNSPGLRAYAAVRFQGAGLFHAFWVVDGRILGTVTDDGIRDGGSGRSGRHTVTLQVRTPHSLVRIPVLTYFVTANEYQTLQ